VEIVVDNFPRIIYVTNKAVPKCERRHFFYQTRSKKDAKLAQKLGELLPFLAVFPQERMGQLVSSGPT
jgi:hypothetical protein